MKCGIRERAAPLRTGGSKDSRGRSHGARTGSGATGGYAYSQYTRLETGSLFINAWKVELLSTASMKQACEV